MSTSEARAPSNDFERWLAAAHRENGSFTALIVLVAVNGTEVAPLCSTSVNVIGPEAAWDDLVVMFAGAGRAWDGAAFFPRQDAHGRPLDAPATRLSLRDLEARLDAGQPALDEGFVFERSGRRVDAKELVRS